jgi:type II secretion system protein G
MPRLTITLIYSALLGMLVGCASTEEQVTQILDESPEMRSSNYKDMAQYPGNVTCGKYPSRDYQGFPVYADFVVIDTVANLNPLPMDISIYCSEDPAAALDATLNISYFTQKLQIDQILEDFRTLAGALEAYMGDNPSYPWTEQGLLALVRPAKTGNPPNNFPEDGYTKSIPTDPWGRSYNYVCEPFAGIIIPFDLTSLGADGVKGGTGENADIKHDYLPYFDHINNL